MADCMTFPDDWHDFLVAYSFDDSKEVYTNGARLIPVFRAEQLIEHLLKAQEPVKPEMIMYTGAGIGISNCPRCGYKIDEYHNDSFCGSCGQAVKWE